LIFLIAQTFFSLSLLWFMYTWRAESPEFFKAILGFCFILPWSATAFLFLVSELGNYAAAKIKSKSEKVIENNLPLGTENNKDQNG